MKTALLAGMVLAVFAFATTPTLAQYELILHKEPVKLQTISGVIEDQTGAFVPGARVELRDPADHRPLGSTHSDSDGRFDFRSWPERRVELLVTAPGFDASQYTLIRSPLGRSCIDVKLKVAT